MKKKQLLQAMKSLPMLAEDKEKFVNIILDNSSGGGKISMSYFKYSTQYLAYFRYYGLLYGKYDDSNNKGIFPYFMYEDNNISTPPKYIAILNDGQDISLEGGMVINKGKSIYDFLNNMSKMDDSWGFDIPATIAKLKSLEITKEEFYNFN